MSGIFAGKVAIVTGGNSGIGKATAIAFAREKAKVVIAARREKESLGTLEEIKKAGSEGIFVQTDVSNIEDLKNMVEQTIQTYGRLDIAFNNAGVLEHSASFTKKEEKEYDFVMDINVKGVFFALKYEIPAMLKNGEGVIVNTSSVAGLVGIGQIPIYTASKHAVMGITKSAALEYASQGIRVNTVNPGGIMTPMLESFIGANKENEDFLKSAHPMGRIGKPEEIAEAVIWLCSPAASFMTGQGLAVDGGWTAQ